MSCVGRVMLANMYDTACQPAAIAVFSLATTSGSAAGDVSNHVATTDVFMRSRMLAEDCRTNGEDECRTNGAEDCRTVDDASPSPDDSTFADISKSRYSDDSTDADDDGRRTPDSDSGGRKDEDEDFETRRSGNGAGSGEKKVYGCQHCKYTTDRKNNLKRHVVTMHEACSKVLECCDVVFKNKASLRDHVLSCHKNGYDCRICGRTFCRKALLKRHITVHSGQKDYVCGVCGYATSHKSNLDRHKRRHGAKYHTNSNSNDHQTNNASRDKDRSTGALSPSAVSGNQSLAGPPPPVPPLGSALAPLQMKLFGENFWWNVLTDPVNHHQVPTAYHDPFSPETIKYNEYKYYYSTGTSNKGQYPFKHKAYRSSLLTKRLFYTYDRSESKDSSHHVNNSDHHGNEDSSKNNLCNEEDEFATTNDPLNGYKQGVSRIDCKSPKKLPSTKKRLFLDLYRCHECGRSFDHQLKLHNHHEVAHTTNDDVIKKVTPQCPLTRLSHVMTSPT